METISLYELSYSGSGHRLVHSHQNTTQFPENNAPF